MVRSSRACTNSTADDAARALCSTPRRDRQAESPPRFDTRQRRYNLFKQVFARVPLRQGLFGGLIALIGAALGGCPEMGPPPEYGEYVDVGGYSIFYRDTGPVEGDAPTVILLSGLGSNVTVWDALIDTLGGEFRMFAYDHGGVGWSEEGRNPRIGSVVANELHTLLRALEIPPPYVLCAHSFGGQFARIYTRLFPGEVAGLVLIDTTHEDEFDQRALLLSPRTAQALEAITVAAQDALLTRGALGESLNRNNTFQQTRANRALPDIPLYFLGQDFEQFRFLPDEDNKQAIQLEESLYQDQAGLVPRGLLEIVAGAGHVIQKTRPDVVAQAIRDVVSGGRQN